MEKYRQFEDVTNGINPFIVAQKKRKLSSFIRFILLPTSIFKYFTFIIGFLFYVIFSSFFKKLSRALEVYFSKIISRILLALLGVYNIYFKFKRYGSKRIPNIIFSSQSTVIDWLMLIHNYSPKFLAIAKSEDNNSDFFFELSSLEIFKYSLGLRFPDTKKISQKRKFDIEKHLENPKQVPLVIFPECTKTDRFGVLKIRSNLLDSIYKFAIEHDNTLLRSEIYINLNGDYNTTDVNGFNSLMKLCERYNTKIEIYSQDIPNDTFDIKDANFDRKKYPSYQIYLDSRLQDYLMEIIHRNTVTLSSFDHIKFLEYYNKTSSDASYVKEK